MRIHIAPTLLAALMTTTLFACSDDEPSQATGGQGGQGADGGAGNQGGVGNQGAGGVGNDGGGGAGNQGGAPPACNEAEEDTVLAVEQVYYGDTDWDGNPSAQAWESFGFDLDGQTTGADLSAHCAPYPGAPPANVADPATGIDNSFGKNLVPIFKALAPDFSTEANLAILAGESTYLIKLDALGNAPNQADLTAKFYSAASLGLAPAFDGSDCWPVRAEGLMDPADFETALVTYEGSTLAGNEWSSNGSQDVVLSFVVTGLQLDVPIGQARMVMTLDGPHTSASGGMIGGAIPVEDLVEKFQQLAGSIDPTLCSGATFDSIANQIRQSADIMADGTQDPTSTCNAISVGVGFTASLAGISTVSPAVAPPPDPCP